MANNLLAGTNSGIFICSHSFKRKIILRIVESIRFYLRISDLQKAEKGLITVLNLVGYISSDIIEVY